MQISNRMSLLLKTLACGITKTTTMELIEKTDLVYLLTGFPGCLYRFCWILLQKYPAHSTSVVKRRGFPCTRSTNEETNMMDKEMFLTAFIQKVVYNSQA